MFFSGYIHLNYMACPPDCQLYLAVYSVLLNVINGNFFWPVKRQTKPFSDDKAHRFRPIAHAAIHDFSKNPQYVNLY